MTSAAPVTDPPAVGSVWEDTCWPDLPEGCRRLVRIASVGPTVTYESWTERDGVRRYITHGRISLGLFGRYFTPVHNVDG